MDRFPNGLGGSAQTCKKRKTQPRGESWRQRGGKPRKSRLNPSERVRGGIHEEMRKGWDCLIKKSRRPAETPPRLALERDKGGE